MMTEMWIAFWAGVLVGIFVIEPLVVHLLSRLLIGSLRFIKPLAIIIISILALWGLIDLVRRAIEVYK